jgi:vacuolar-type H+-ATPase subunit I/STV1
VRTHRSGEFHLPNTLPYDLLIMFRREKAELVREKRRTRAAVQKSVDIGTQIARDNDESRRRLEKAQVTWHSVPTDKVRNVEYVRLLRQIVAIQKTVRAAIWVEREEAERLTKEISETSGSDVVRLLELHRQFRELETREIETHKPRLREFSNEYRNAVMEFEDFVYAK